MTTFDRNTVREAIIKVRDLCPDMGTFYENPSNAYADGWCVALALLEQELGFNKEVPR